MPSAIAEPQEIHVGLDLPHATARQIYQWARKQDWPEGTQLEHQKDYHVTLMFSTEGREHKDAWWIEHLDAAEVSVNGVTAFPSGEKGGFAYVLLLEAPEVSEKATEMQERGKAFGLPIRDFDGGYQPHVTVAYGPSPRLNIETPNFTFDVGPSSVSPMRPKESSAPPEPPNYRKQDKSSEHCGNCKMFFEGRCWGFANKEVRRDAVCDEWAPEEKRSAYHPDEVKILDHLSLTNVAANLHYKFAEGGLDDEGATEYAKKLLQLIGYPIDGITVKAAIDTWQKLYPGDKLLNPAPPTVPTESYGYGTTSNLNEDELRKWWEDKSNQWGLRMAPWHIRPQVGEGVDPSDTDANEFNPSGTGNPVFYQGYPHKPEYRGFGLRSDEEAFAPLSEQYNEGYNTPHRLKPNPDAEGWDFGITPRQGSQASEKFAASHRDLSYSFSKRADLHDEVLPSWENKGFTVLHEETPEQVHLHTVELPPDTRGQGYGHRFMDNIKHYVDQNGKPLVVDPVFNPQFFDKFDWLNPTGERRYEYQPQRVEASEASHCLNCGHPLEDPLDTCPECRSTVPSQVNNPEDHIPDFGQRPPDQKRDVQFSGDFNYR